MKRLIYTINLTQLQKIVCLLVILLTITNLVHAGIGDPGGSTGSGDPDDAPIDGGLSLLIAGGVGYGIRQMRKKKNKATESKG